MREGLRRWTSPEEHLPSFLAVAHHHSGTGRGQLNEGVMFGQLSITSWALSFSFLRSVRGCVGMHVWVNVFTMPFLCIFCQYCPRTGGKASEVEQPRGADAKLPGRRPPTHWTRRGLLNEVMFGELRILLFVCFRSVHGWMGMDVWVNVCLYDAILLRRLWTVEKYVWGASAKLPGRRPPRRWTGRGQVNEGVMFGELRVLLFVLGVCMGGWE